MDTEDKIFISTYLDEKSKDFENLFKDSTSCLIFQKCLGIKFRGYSFSYPLHLNSLTRVGTIGTLGTDKKRAVELKFNCNSIPMMEFYKIIVMKIARLYVNYLRTNNKKYKMKRSKGGLIIWVCSNK